MPKRTDIQSILIIGSGPIVIGQACEFDYSGTQGCKALREEGYRVILVNSNPATIMTDPEMGDRTYIEPITPEVVARIIEQERPDALLPTLGGQTALNTAVALADLGVLDKYGVELIGARLPAIRKAEDRELFKQAMAAIGLEVPESATVGTLEAALAAVERVGYPAIIRPSFTLGGTGGSVAYNREEYEERVQWGLNLSPTHQILVEASVLGWKEYELEVMRDLKDNVVIVCSIENIDPMGIHTGDSITVAPAQTLTDKEYQMMRDAAVAIIREIGVDTGGSNIQFAVEPETGRMVVIEMNPRVSRSSALASKATGFPIAKIAAKLAVGYTLDEVQNDITRETPASFEPTIDYCVVKYPRWAFEKFPGADDTLTTQMKSVGEAMAIGRTFKEALQKAIRSLEIDAAGLETRLRDGEMREAALARIRERIAVPKADRLFHLADALRLGMPIEEIAAITRIDPWFLANLRQLVEAEVEIAAPAGGGVAADAPGDARRDAPGQAAGLLRPTPGAPHGERRADGAGLAQAAGGRGHLQAGGYLRRGVRGRYALSLLHLRAGVRGGAHRAPQGDDSRRRPESHRAGDRVRLLLRARRPRSPGAGLRDHHGQLQPRDGLHGLRHGRPALLRAAHAGGRPQHRGHGEACRG